MPRYGNYETAQVLSARGSIRVYLAQRVSGGGPATAVVKVLQLSGDAGGRPEFREAAPAAPSAPPAPSGPAPGGRRGHDVFVSHSAKDKAKADAVCDALEKGGVRCWIAPRDILPGANWATSILKAIA